MKNYGIPAVILLTFVSLVFYTKKDRIFPADLNNVADQKVSEENDQPKPTPTLVETTPKNLPIAAQETKNPVTLPDVQSEPEQTKNDQPSISKEDAKSYRKALKQPFCRENNFILPSFYLRQFFQTDKVRVILPEEQTRCAVANKEMDIYFFDFDSDLLVPYRPLTKMRATVKKKYTTGNLNSSIKQLSENDNFLVLRNIKTEKIADLLLNFFTGFENLVYTTILIDRISIDENPNYFYQMPEIHPQAKVISAADALKLDNRQSDFIIIDLRPKEMALKNPLKFNSKIIHRGGAFKQSDFYAQLDFLNQKTAYTNISFSKKKHILLVGQDPLDLTPYNYANVLMVEGFTHLYIFREGASYFKYETSKIPQPNLKNIDWFTLKKMMSESRKSKNITLVDCRSKKEYARSTIEDANLEPYITEYPATNNIIFFARNRADNRIINCIEDAKKKNIGSNLYYYANGYLDWQFKQKFVEQDVSEESKVQNRGSNQRASMPTTTERIMRSNTDPKNRVHPDQERGAGAVDSKVEN